MSEYTNTSTAGAPCSYADLGNYNADYSMAVPAQGKVITGKYMVPQWDAISYESLTAPVPSCSGYSNISNAYGKNAGSCQTSYKTSLCGTR